MPRRNLLLLLLLLVLLQGARAQSISCPPNIDFEFGNTSIWHYYTGSCCPVATPTPTAAIPTRHTLMSGSGLDYYGGFPVVPPGSGSYTLKLGNASVGAQAERARYYIHVPATASTYALAYRYAVVFEDPGHPVSIQPRFEVEATDSVFGTSLDCAHITYVSAPGLPGFHVSPIDPGVYYKNWATGMIDLSGYGGHTIIVDFTSADCGAGGHFGYGYLDMSCGLFAINTAACDTSNIILAAPLGFYGYEWYDPAFTTLLDTARILDTSGLTSPTTFAVILHPEPGYGCPDTLYTTVLPSHLLYDPMRDTITCPGVTTLLHPHATDITGPLTYTWTSSSGALLCTTCDSIHVAPSVPTQYIVTITSPAGCSATDTVMVYPSFSLVSSADTVLCDSSGISIGAAVTGLYPPFSYAWVPASGLSCTTCSSPIASGSTTMSYVVTISDSVGCHWFDTISVAREILSIAPMTDVIFCGSAGGTLTAGISGTGSALTYLWSPGTGLSCTTCSAVTATPTVATTYILTATGPLGCALSDTVVVAPAFWATPLADTLRCDSLAVAIGTTVTGYYPPYTYAWSPTAGLSCATCASTTATGSLSVSYILTITDSIGCTATDTSTIEREIITIVPMTDTIFCTTAGGVLTSGMACMGSLLSYTWSPATGLSCTSCAVVTASPSVATTYILTGTGTLGCTLSDTVVVDRSYITLPGLDTFSCDSLGITIGSMAAGPHPPFSYAWVPMAGISCTACVTPVVTGTATASYSVTVTDAAGCTLSATANVERELLYLSPIRDTTFCPNISIPLTAGISSNGAPLTYFWSPASDLNCTTCASVIASPAAATTYMLTATGPHGCSLSDAFTLYPDIFYVDIPADTVICAGLDLELKAITNATTPHYTWTPSTDLNCSTCATVILSPSTPHVITVSVTDSLGCVSRDAINVGYNIMSYYIIADTPLCDGSAIALARTEAVSSYPVTYAWSPASGLSCTNCAMPLATPQKSTTYQVVVTDATGCSYVDNVEVGIELCDIWFPSAFTPNSDGKNDIARVVGHLRFYKDFSLGIYNRYGQRVYYTTDIYSGWDGVFNDIPADIGVYFYQIFYTLHEETKMLKGDITLIR